MKINCLDCGKEFTLPAYLHQAFEGEVKCTNCKARLFIALKEETLKTQKLVERSASLQVYSGKISKSVEKSMETIAENMAKIIAPAAATAASTAIAAAILGLGKAKSTTKQGRGKKKKGRS